jgi:hypothetical protein
MSQHVGALIGMYLHLISRVVGFGLSTGVCLKFLVSLGLGSSAPKSVGICLAFL